MENDEAQTGDARAMDRPSLRPDAGAEESDLSRVPSLSIPPSEPFDRASESIVASTEDPAAKQTSAISSSPLLVGTTASEVVAVASSSVPPSLPAMSTAPYANAMGRDRSEMPLSRLVGIGCGIFVTLVALSLLLFR